MVLLKIDTNDKRASKKSYYRSYFEKNKHKSSEIWKGIRSLVNLKPSKASSYKLLDENDNLITDPKRISNIFNNHFSTIGPKIERKIPHVPGSFRDYFSKKDKNGNLLFNPSNTFSLAPTVPAEVEKIIDALDMKKSTGPCSIPVLILKMYKPFFSFKIIKINQYMF